MDNSFNEVCRIAIEKGGYKTVGWNKLENRPRHGTDFNQIILDPLFWQALGKACGWNMDDSIWNATSFGYMQEWRYHAHQYFDIKLEDQLHVEHTGKTEEEFWKELLESNH